MQSDRDHCQNEHFGSQLPELVYIGIQHFTQTVSKLLKVKFTLVSLDTLKIHKNFYTSIPIQE